MACYDAETATASTPLELNFEPHHCPPWLHIPMQAVGQSSSAACLGHFRCYFGWFYLTRLCLLHLSRLQV